MSLLHPVPLESPLFCASKPQLLGALCLMVSICNCLQGLALGHWSSFACWCRKSEVPSSLHCPHLLPGKIQQPGIFWCGSIKVHLPCMGAAQTWGKMYTPELHVGLSWALNPCLTYPVPCPSSPTLLPVFPKYQFSSVQSLSRVRLFAARQTSLSITNSQSLRKLLSIKGDAIQPSHPLFSPSPPAPNPSQHQGLFQWVNSSHEVVKVLEFQLQHQSLQWTPRTDFL